MKRAFSNASLIPRATSSVANTEGPVMDDTWIYLCIVGALFTAYGVAATWRSQHRFSPMREEIGSHRARSVERRLRHWWRARRRRHAAQVIENSAAGFE